MSITIMYTIRKRRALSLTRINDIFVNFSSKNSAEKSFFEISNLLPPHCFLII